MSKRTRTILFVICVFFFLLAAPGLVLYSQGYRFDFEHKKLTQTGAFYCKVLPRGAEVYLDGKLKDTTSFFTNALLIENLLPGSYEIEIKKDGYHPWQKTVQVSEKEVTEAKHIILIPQDANFQLLTENEAEISKILADLTEKKDIDETPAVLADLNFKDFRLSPDDKKVAYFTDHEIWVLFLENQYDLQKESGEKIFLTRFSEKIGEAVWLNSYYLMFSAGDKIKVTEIDNRDRLNIVEVEELKSPEIYWDKKTETAYALSEGKLYFADRLLP